MRANGEKQDIIDSATWTIISTERVEYRFCNATAPSWAPVTPIPLVSCLSFNEQAQQPDLHPNGTQRLTITGIDFDPNLCVWFGAYKCSTIYRCVCKFYHL